MPNTISSRTSRVAVTLASRRNGTLYIGVTSDLVARVWQHKEKVVPGFTSRYGCNRLVYFEVADNAEAAITREIIEVVSGAASAG